MCTAKPAYRASRNRFLISCATVAIATAGLLAQRADAQAFQGTISSTTGTVTRTNTSTTAETITVGSPTATINWTPTGRVNANGNLDFLPTGNVATFQGTANAGTYTVHAAFAGNTNYGAASADKTITIGQATATVVITLNASNGQFARCRPPCWRSPRQTTISRCRSPSRSDTGSRPAHHAGDGGRDALVVCDSLFELAAARTCNRVVPGLPLRRRLGPLDRHPATIEQALECGIE